jgi:flagellar hook protein FlgE
MTILNASVSGMLADQNWLSSISQNIANANTTGYKNVETDFSTLVDQVSNVASDGGGVQTSLRSLNTLQGNVVTSQTPTNIAVQGSGFFVVSDLGGNLYLTRNGTFIPDSSGNLVNSAGYYLRANNVQNGQTATAANSLAGLQKVNVVNAGQTATPTTSGSLTANLPSGSGTVPAADLPSANGANATYTSETSLVVYDNLGTAHTVNLYFSKTGTGTWEVDAYDASQIAKDAAGPPATTPNPFDPKALLGSMSSTNPLTFSANGTLPANTTLTLTNPTGSSILSTGQSISLDLSNITQLATSFNVTAATANGNAPASLQGVSIANDGTLSFNYSNGTSNPAYKIPLANVESPDNLSFVNGNAFLSNASSGPIFLGSAGQASLGSIDSSSLESSTVDLATELTSMIEAQSSYEASSKVFQTGANILDILNNLKA